MATLLFDLDGTLIDSAVGITRCMAHAFERVGEPVPNESTLRSWIGPSLRVSFTPVLKDEARVEQAVTHYLERFETQGWTEHTVYDGVADAIDALHARGHRLAVVTAKNEPHARKIIASLPFADRFVDIVGATLDGRISHKPELIAEALQRLGADPRDCTMIGDRRMDMEGAVHHGMRGVGVLWGFGDEAELRSAGASVLVDRPDKLLAIAA
ncbi:HAD hydrolase-like protein [Lysobacter claricitrinus]|uniref:HAD hydrolase-like protein n=1 Tax=Lysobacter claricitrinus TaxID=3367728 RepID=UPI0037DB80FB